MQIVSVDPQEPRLERVELAVEVLRGGGVVALPTETFYGLAADSANPEAVLRVNRLKGKPDDSPVLLLLSEAGQAQSVAGTLPESFVSLSAMFWPGPLTLVVPAAPSLPIDVSARRGTVAVRVPGMGLPRRIAATLGRPITGPSANRSTEPACRTAAEVAIHFPTGLDLILDGGPTPGGLASTILDLTTDRPTVLRKGLLPLSALEPFLGSLRDPDPTRSL